ncbi:MAG: BstXI family restriction endonuclease [Anaerolineaceae bacterium]|nr:BstXI family restriction endonuclease [Anaerolineaceae bacterium]
MPRLKLPKLPKLLDRKIYKTGQTRGADDDEIYQNRVGRNSTVLIPYSVWIQSQTIPHGEDGFENGFIALVSPARYFGEPAIEAEFEERNLVLGENALVFLRHVSTGIFIILICLTGNPLRDAQLLWAENMLPVSLLQPPRRMEAR